MTLTTFACTVSKGLRALPDAWMVLGARLALAAFFIRSGQTKITDDFELSSTATYLFEQEYDVPLLEPATAAWAAIAAEHVFPAMLILGLGTRLAAGGLMAMTLVIQVFVYPGSWPDHLMWAVLLALILARGPGPLAVDNAIARHFCPKASAAS